jgi:MYXO-CTERM domain-containing protein
MPQVSTLTMLKIQLTQLTARLSIFFAGLCASGLSLNLLSGMPARALTVTNSEIFSTVLQVDGGSGFTDLDVGRLGASVTNVLLSVSLTKCGGSIGSTGACNSLDFSYNDEIILGLYSPTGTYAGMVYQSDLSGQASGATVTWNFQDSFSSPIGGPSLVSGNYPNYQPSDPFSIFNRENPNGTWRLYYQDTFTGAPLSINSWSISVTDENGPGPADVPGPLPLAGLAAAFGWSRLLRKRIRVKRDHGAGL